MREKVIEQYLREQVYENFGRCFKWVSPGNPGVPDRIVIFKNNVIVFVELKSSVGKLRFSQKVQMKTLEELDCLVYTLNSKTGVDLFLEDMREKGLI